MEENLHNVVQRVVYGLMGSFMGSLITLAMLWWIWDLNWTYVAYGATVGFALGFIVGEQAVSVLVELFKSVW